MMKLVTAPQNLADGDDCLKIFLAGGIQKCVDWQTNVANYLLGFKWGKDRIALINPRQPHFDMNDPLAGEKQIKWEFKYLNMMDMFTMFFYGPTESDQPICFYELGRYIEVMKNKFPDDWQNRIVVTVCSEFKRREDVIVQTKLATSGEVEPICFDTYELAISWHRNAIANAIGKVC